MSAGHVCRPCLLGLSAGHVCRPCLLGMSAGHVCRACLPGLSAGHVCRACLPSMSAGQVNTTGPALSQKHFYHKIKCILTVKIDSFFFIVASIDVNDFIEKEIGEHSAHFKIFGKCWRQSPIMDHVSIEELRI
jgi:hypothetical protein